jgi:uncharacterized protein YjiS (DUF1127 family)
MKTMNVHFNLASQPLSDDAHLRTRSNRALGKSIRHDVDWIAGSIRHAWEMFATWLVRRHVRRGFQMLEMLDDRMLADIGIRRSEIPGLAHRVVRGRTVRRNDL